MKNTLLIAALLFSGISFCQEPVTKNKPELATPSPEKEDIVIYDVVDEPADFPGGMSACRKYLSDNTIYPESALKNKLEGKCYVKFVVLETGEIYNIKVVRGIMDCPECDAEVVRVIKSMPNWVPGKMNGKPVNSTFTLPVQFIL